MQVSVCILYLHVDLRRFASRTLFEAVTDALTKESEQQVDYGDWILLGKCLEQVNVQRQVMETSTSELGFENDASVETWIISDCGIVTRGQAIDELYNAAVQRKIEDGEEDVATTMPLMNCENKVTFSERSYAHCSMYRYVHPRPFDSILGMSHAHYPLPDQALSRRCIQGCIIA